METKQAATGSAHQSSSTAAIVASNHGIKHAPRLPFYQIRCFVRFLSSENRPLPVGQLYNRQPNKFIPGVLYGLESVSVIMPPKQATLGYVKNSQQTLGWECFLEVAADLRLEVYR